MIIRKTLTLEDLKKEILKNNFLPFDFKVIKRGVKYDTYEFIKNNTLYLYKVKKVSGKKKVQQKKKTSPKKKVSPKKKTSPKKKVEPKKKVSPKKKTSPKKKVEPKKKVSPKKKTSPKKKVISKQSKKRQKKIYKLNELKKLAFKIDLRKLSKEQREYVKSIRREAKENYFKQKFTIYLLAGIEEYLSLFGTDVLSKFYEELKKQGISKRILNKIQAGKKISNKKYQAFMNYINNNFNNTELAFFWRIVNYMKENRGIISHKKIRQIINELYDFLNYIPDEFDDFADLDLYDYLSFTSG